MVLFRTAHVSSLTLALLAIAGPLSSVAPAGSTWDGGSTANDNWTSGANWYTVGTVQAPPPNNGTANVVMAGTTRLTPNMDAGWSIDSLRFASTAGAFTLSSSTGDTLTIDDGGVLNQSGLLQTINHDILLAADQTWTAEFGGFQINGDVSTRGFLPSDLAISGNYGTILSGRLLGIASLTKTGSQLLLLNGPLANTFSGPTYVNAGRLRLDKEVADGAIRGDLVIGDGLGNDRVILLRDEQILASSSRTVTVNSAGVFELNGFEETVHNLAVRGGAVDMTLLGSRLNVTNLTMQGGSIVDPPGSTVAPLYFYGPIVRSEAAATTGTIDAFLDLSQVTTFEVADGAPDIDLDLTHVVNARIIKTGAGTLRVRGDSRTLGIHIVAGTMTIGDTPPTYDYFDFVFEGGTLRADIPLGTFADINITGAATIDGPNDLTLYGVISGPGGLTKRGSGTLTFGSIYVANTYTGVTTVAEGTLVLDNRSGPNAAIVSNLVIGDGIGGPAADVVRLDSGQQIVAAAGRSVTVNDSGYFHLNGKSEEVQDLIINGGLAGGASGTLTVHSLTMQAGAVSMGTGKMVANGNLATNPAPLPATISGKLELGGQTRTMAINDGPAAIDLDIPAAISNGGINKTSPGTLRLSGDNTFAGGITVSAGTLLVDSAIGSATGTGLVTVLDGTLSGAGTIAGNLESRGLVSPGASPGTLKVGGYYAQILDGELLIELAAAADFDQLHVTGEAFLGGTLTVDLINGFTPSPGQTFTVLTADDVDGVFTTEPVSPVPGLVFDVIYNPQSVVLTISSAFTADFDEDGDVDDDDLTRWRNNFGTGSTHMTGDADGDGDADGVDFLAWQRQLGSPPSVAGAAAVPEPHALVLIGLATVAMLRRDVLNITSRRALWILTTRRGVFKPKPV